MKVHPQPAQSFTFRQAASLIPSGDLTVPGCRKGLRRLPHVFDSVLQLPFQSDADVAVEESTDCFRFVAVSDDIHDVRVDVIAMNPGLVKVLIREAASAVDESLASSDDELELEPNVWRVRLPVGSRPERASAVFAGGELVVTVPKRSGDRSRGDVNMGDLGRLVLAQ